MMYLLTEQEHAQIVEVLEIARSTAMNNVMAARIPECGDFAAIAQNLDWSVSTLKAMKPVEPELWRFSKSDMVSPYNHDSDADWSPLYAKG